MGSLYIDDPAPRNRALETFGQPSLGSGVAAGTAAEDAWIRSGFPSALRGQEQTEAAAGTRMPETGPVLGDGLFISQSPPQGATPLLPAEEATRRYGIQGELSFDRPTREAEAELLYRWKTEELKRRNILMRATPGLLPGAARLGTSFLVGMVDPLNVASAFVPAVGEARFAYLAGKLGKTGARVARGAAEGAVGAAVVEPFIYFQAQREQADYDAYDSLLNLAFGSVLGGGLHAGAGWLSDRISAAPIEVRETALRGAVAAVAEDRPVAVAEVFGPTRLRLMEATTLSRTGELFMPAAPEAPRAPAQVQRADVSIPTLAKDGTIQVFQTEAQAQKAVSNAARRGDALAVEALGDGTYRTVTPAKLEILDEFIDERAAMNAVKRMPPPDRVQISVIPRPQPDGTMRYAIASGLSPKQAAAIKANPAALDESLQRTPLQPAEQAPAAPKPFDLEAEIRASMPRIAEAQRASQSVQPSDAQASAALDRLAEGYDQPITPETSAEEAADLIEATNEALALAKKEGVLTEADEAAIKGDPEAEKMAKGRAAGIDAAVSCLARLA